MNDYRAYVMCDYNSIYHFGTDGMKWGRRRYQNEDGSYKPGAEGRYYDKKGGKIRKSDPRVGYQKDNSFKGKTKRFLGDHKQEIAAGAIAVGTLALAYAAYKKANPKKVAETVSKVADGVNKTAQQAAASQTVKQAANTTAKKVASASKKAANVDYNKIHDIGSDFVNDMLKNNAEDMKKWRRAG